jgi:hypothetical protein
MFTQVLENVGKVTGATVAAQQEMFKRWISLWPDLLSSPPAGGEQTDQFRKRWTATAGELLKRQREMIDAQFKAGLQNIEKAFKLGEAKNPEELRAATIALWRKCFDSLTQAAESQIRETHAAVEKWFDLLTTSVPSS